MAEPADTTERKGFPIARALWRFAKKARANWMERHQLPFNFWIHMIGIPMALSGVVLVFFEPWWGLAAFVVGYLLQYIGHRAEGNDLGEWAGIKRLGLALCRHFAALAKAHHVYRAAGLSASLSEPPGLSRRAGPTRRA